MPARNVESFPLVGPRCRAPWSGLKSRRNTIWSQQRALDSARQSPPPPSDPLPELLAATARGDRRAFAELYQLTKSRLYAITLALLRQQDAAEDRAIELLRQRRRRAAETHAESLAEDALQIPDPSPAPAVDHLAHAIQECLRRLSDDQSAAIKLAFFHGHSHEELAARLQTPLGTVKSWIRRGLLQLKGCLDS